MSDRSVLKAQREKLTLKLSNDEIRKTTTTHLYSVKKTSASLPPSPCVTDETLQHLPAVSYAINKVFFFFL